MPPPSEIAVAVTGLGMTSPLGLDVPSTWQALLAGKGSRELVDLFPTSGCRCAEAAQVRLPPAQRLERRLSRGSRLAVRAGQEAVDQARLPSRARENIAVCLSTTGGGMELGEAFIRTVMERKPARRLDLITRYQAQQQALDVQQALGISGPITLIGNACASGANAIGHGYDQIKAGVVDCVVAGGYEALSETLFAGFDSLQLLSTSACRPFDQHRDGLMLGEGAAVLMLENAEHAQARGAEILGFVRGYGHAIDLHRLTQPDPTGAALSTSMRAALADAGLQPGDIVHINAHGTGTLANDAAELAAYAEVFGSGLGRIAICSTKAAMGHALGAAGAMEAIFALLAARDAITPPQLNLRAPLPEMASSLARAGHLLSPNGPVLSVNLGFGGSNAALVFTS